MLSNVPNDLSILLDMNRMICILNNLQVSIWNQGRNDPRLRRWANPVPLADNYQGFRCHS